VILLDDDYSPPSGAYYLRQESWSQFNGTRLVATTRADADGDQVADYPTERTPVADPPPEAGRTHVHAMVAMLAEHAHPFALESALVFSLATNPNPQRFVRAYRFESLAQTIDYRRLVGHRAGNPHWSAELRAYYTDGPDDPRYAQLAHQIVQGLAPANRNDPFAEAAVIKLWLDHELIYSTRARHAGMADPTADFLFGDRTGYCVHFAHAAVYLWRALGIPSRISTGYHYDEANRHGGSTIVVRASDAHAWPELYLDGVGWIVLDIAAERNLDPPGRPADDDLQRLLGEMARGQPPDPAQPPQRRRGAQHSRPLGRAMAMGGLWSLVLVLAALYAIKLWRRMYPAFAGARSIPRVGYRAALDVLAEAGYSRAFGETREGFARRLANVTPSFEALTAMHLAARLGEPSRGASAWRPERPPRVWRTTLSDVRREIGRAPRWWRRLLGAINPASFLDAR
jgi:transglutaminase-like putative cysteine protease